MYSQKKILSKKAFLSKISKELGAIDTINYYPETVSFFLKKMRKFFKKYNKNFIKNQFKIKKNVLLRGFGLKKIGIRLLSPYLE